MPRRDANHVVGDQAARRVQDLFDPWPVRLVESNDYGVDAEVDIFDEDGRATGLTFKVQIKGSGKELGGRPPKVRVNTSSLNYWLALDVPVLISYVALASGDVYARWAHSYDPVVSRSAKAKKSPSEPRTTTFSFSSKDRVTSFLRSQVHGEVQAVRALRQKMHTGPLHFGIEYDDAGIENECFGLEQALHLNFPDLGGVVLFNNDNEMSGTLRVGRDRFRVALPVELGSFTVHTRVFERLRAADESLAPDIFIAVAVLFARMGLSRPAITLTKRVQLLSEMPISLEIAGPLAEAAAQHGDYDTAVRLLSVPLVGPIEEEREFAEWLLALIHHNHIDGLSEAGIDVFVYSLSRRMELEQSLGKPEEAGRLAYTKASIQRNSRPPRFEDALATYSEVERLAPAYLERSYFHQEIGGIHADCGRWFSALDRYNVAKILDDHPDGLDFYVVDTLVHCGRYWDALSVAQAESKDSERFRLRTELWVVALKFWTEFVRYQNRHQLLEVAFSQLGDGRTVIEYLRVLASTDVLDENLHAALAATLISESGTEEAALAIALTSAHMMLDEPYPWVMSIHLLLKLGYSKELARTAAAYLIRFAPQTVANAIEQYRENLVGNEYSELIQLIREYIRQSPETPPRTLRIMREDGGWDAIEL